MEYQREHNYVTCKSIRDIAKKSDLKEKDDRKVKKNHKQKVVTYLLKTELTECIIFWNFQ